MSEQKTIGGWSAILPETLDDPAAFAQAIVRAMGTARAALTEARKDRAATIDHIAVTTTPERDGVVVNLTVTIAA